MRRDEAYLLDILLAARRACQFLEGLTWEEFLRSELHQNAVMRPLGIIGEAASRVSQEMKDEYPEIPWHQMVGMRNRLVHEYFRVDLATVWETVRTDLPSLIELIEPLCLLKTKAKIEERSRDDHPYQDRSRIVENGQATGLL